MENKEQNKNKPEGQKPKNFWTPLLITLVLVLIFSWVFNAVSRSQYKETTWSDFLEALESGQLEEVELQPQTGKILYLTKEEAAKELAPEPEAPQETGNETWSALQGMGNTMMPMASGIAEFVMRTGAALLLPAFIGYWGVFWAEVLAWIGADLILVSSYYLSFHKIRRQNEASVRL